MVDTTRYDFRGPGFIPDLRCPATANQVFDYLLAHCTDPNLRGLVIFNLD